MSFRAGQREYTHTLFSLVRASPVYTNTVMATMSWPAGYMPGDELVDPLVDRAERVLAQHGALGLVVELEVHPVDGEVAPLLLRPADELAAQPGPGGLRRDRLGLEDVEVAGDPVDRARAAPAGSTGRGRGGRRGRPGRAGRPAGEDSGRSCLARYRSISWYLVTQSISRSTRSRLPVSIASSVRSHRSSTRLAIGVARRCGRRSRRPCSRYSRWISSALASRPLASRTLRRPVMSWLTSRMARIGFSSVRSRITTPASIIRSTRSVAPTLSSVVVSLMLESPTMTCSRRKRSASACGSSRVLMIGRRAGGGRGHALPDVLGPLADAVDRAARGLQHLAGAADDLPGDQERDQHVGQPAELAVPADQVVLVAAVGVAGGVGVVLEQVDVAGDALFAQPPLGVDEQALEDPLPRLVVGDQVDRRRRTRAWRTRGGCRRRGRAGRRCAGRRCCCGPSDTTRRNR